MQRAKHLLGSFVPLLQPFSFSSLCYFTQGIFFKNPACCCHEGSPSPSLTQLSSTVSCFKPFVGDGQPPARSQGLMRAIRRSCSNKRASSKVRFGRWPFAIIRTSVGYTPQLTTDPQAGGSPPFKDTSAGRPVGRPAE